MIGLPIRKLPKLRQNLFCDFKITITFASFKEGFPGSSVGKEPTYHAGDPISIPGSRRCTGEGIGYPLQCSWASLVAQLVKNTPEIQET